MVPGHCEIVEFDLASPSAALFARSKPGRDTGGRWQTKLNVQLVYLCLLSLSNLNGKEEDKSVKPTETVDGAVSSENESKFGEALGICIREITMN